MSLGIFSHGPFRIEDSILWQLNFRVQWQKWKTKPSYKTGQNERQMGQRRIHRTPGKFNITDRSGVRGKPTTRHWQDSK